ncbi:hypothetical protein CZ787_12585 [Halomonas citrativorans]|uniref:Uncharacterized protein n=1 Tax=Halomonas citrativorans TaxID=2742612 RepID=A0A1R4I2E6_9GAMM|nr:hypothetical protein [Halomonas citrativorans]SJN13928.1 hypothetical protein CZ787_12585 [Halomonas citrativorans]
MHALPFSRLLITAGLSSMLALLPLTATAYESELFSLKNRWEHTMSGLPANQREGTLKVLSDEATTLVSENSDQPELLVWQGIILASYARERGGFGALGIAGDARDALEQAIALDPQGGNGSAYVTLGALYDNVPGRPISFGSSEKARQMFQRAVEIRPEGIDVNYYYAEFLLDEGDTAAAREHAERAVSGTPRAQRELSDEALRRDAQAMLNRL